MNVSEVLAKDLNREIKVDVPRDNIEDKLLSKLEELKNTVQLKGFRPGKVPIHHLRKVFGQRLMPEIIEDLVKETSAKAMSDRIERPAIQPKISFYQGKPSEDKEKEEIDKKIVLTDEDALRILQRMIKQRKESISQFADAGRTELAEKEEKEISLLQDFLPEQLGEEEIRELVTEAISATEASEPADIGKVMGALKSKIKGNADMGLVSRIVKENLA